LRFLIAVAGIAFALSVRAACMPLPKAEWPTGAVAVDSGDVPDSISVVTSETDATLYASPDSDNDPAGAQQSSTDPRASDPPVKAKTNVEVDANGNPIPLERQQPQRILGFMPNFRSVSGGAKPHPPGWKYNFIIATHQAVDYSSFIFLGLTSLSAKGIDEHPVLGKGVGGLWAYTWRGFLDKTDGTYIGAWFLPSLIHEDTRYYAMGNEHSILVRELYVISRQGVTRTYGEHQTPNIAGLGGKVLTQLVSRQYYPPGATSFPVLAEKFGYSAMRDVIFTSIREFYPDIAAHYIRKHREKMLRTAELDESSEPDPAASLKEPE